MSYTKSVREGLKDFKEDVKEMFTYENFRERILKRPAALATAFLAVAVPAGLFVKGLIDENSAPFVDRFRAEFAQVAGGKQETYILVGAGVLHSRVYGRMTYQGPDGVRCALEIEQPLNFWGTQENGPEKRQQVCGADVEPVTLSGLLNGPNKIKADLGFKP